MILERWKRTLPVKKLKFIDGAAVFRNYGSVWLLLEDLSQGLTDQSFKSHQPVLRVISRDHLLMELNNCLELGNCVGADDLDVERVRELIERVKSLDPDTMVDIEGI